MAKSFISKKELYLIQEDLQMELTVAKGLIGAQKRALENYISSPDDIIMNLIWKSKVFLGEIKINDEPVISSSGEIHPEKYETVEIPLSKIEKMMKDGCWHGSLEEEEVLCNLANNYYSGEYEKKLKKFLKENE